MAKYCLHTGEELNEVGDFREHWCVIYRSTTSAYIQVHDAGKGDFPLIELQRGVFDKLMNASPELVTLAFGRLRPIDCRTISLLDFETTLLGCYTGDAP